MKPKNENYSQFKPLIPHITKAELGFLLDLGRHQIQWNRQSKETKS